MSLLAQNIQKAYKQLISTIALIPEAQRNLKKMKGTGGTLSATDLIAYQIGWGKCLIRWYEAGLQKEFPQMPGDGFTQWNYTEIAKHFYQKYGNTSPSAQLKAFSEIVARMIEITNLENKTGNLDRLGVWPWCTLASGKQWPLSKWIQVNTVAPYKKATQQLRKTFLQK